MKSTTAAPLLVLTAATLASALTIPAPDYELFRRSVVSSPSSLAQQYDYVIIGGGLAGLVVANRLSANPNVTVAVIEAGSSGYSDNAKFVVPAANLYNSAVGTQYDWQWKTTPQPGLNGRQATWPRGKVLGGSSAINGLYYVRHSEEEQTSWSRLIGDDGWSWANMLGAMKKSETFTPPDTATTSMFSVPYDAGSHGTDGPLHVTFPAKTYPQVGAFLDSTSAVGIPRSQNPDGGDSWGAFLATSNINPSNWTRSFSRTAYLDPVTYRSNLDVLTDHTVTKIVFNSTSGDAVASGVEFASGSGAQRQTVGARKEVILCGGAVNDPQILQLSGIASPSILSPLRIPTVVDLPGVGYHLQDHLSTGVVFTPSSGAEMPAQRVTGNAEADSYVNSAIAYVSGATIFGNSTWSTMVDQMKTDKAANIAAYDAPAEVKAGYNATYTAQVEDLFPTDLGPIELLFALSFGGVQVQAALQHPLSRGSIKINSADPFASPSIDPAYLSNPNDMTILREGFKLARKVGTTAPLANFTSSESNPGSSVETDSQWESWIRGAVGTEFHPSSTCSMLPREQGGVVDANLRVYGTQNVRVVDASVPPISFSAHLMSIVYGLAERGSEMIMADYEAGMRPPSSSSNSSAISAGGAKGGAKGTGAGTAGSAAGANGNTSAASPISAVAYSATLTTALLAIAAGTFL